MHAQNTEPPRQVADLGTECDSLAQAMKVVSWNLAWVTPGYRDKQDDAWRYLVDELRPDLALLQEVGRIPDFVSDNFRVVAPQERASTAATWWSSVIIGRPDISLEEIPTAQIGNWVDGPLLYGYIATGRIVLGDEPVFVASVHAPPRAVEEDSPDIPNEDLEAMRLEPLGSKRRRAKVWYSDLAFEALDRYLTKGQRFLIGGDWNTARLFDNFSTYPPTGTAFFVRARERGWHDCHGEENEERTLLKPGTRPYQLDHMFCDRQAAKKLASCRVLGEPEIAELSDHAPLVAHFGD